MPKKVKRKIELPEIKNGNIYEDGWTCITPISPEFAKHTIEFYAKQKRDTTKKM